MLYLLATLAALIHVYIFLLESVWWGKPATNKAFGMTADLAEANRVFAFNQGFYNLFLAAAAATGVVLSRGGRPEAGRALIACAALSMLGAAIVLVCSKRGALKAALVQGLVPFLALLFLALAGT